MLRLVTMLFFKSTWVGLGKWFDGIKFCRRHMQMVPYLNLSYHPRLRLEDPVQELPRAQGVAALLEFEGEHGVGEHLWEDVGQPARGHDPQVPGEPPPLSIEAFGVRDTSFPVIQ